MVETGTKRIDPLKGKKLVFETDENGCIVCISHTPNHDGYQRIYNGKDAKPRLIMLHRATWQVQNGPVPDGYEIDHKCRNRRCCNPEHLQLLTISAHKTKTNLERYADRILAIKEDLLNGMHYSEIAEKHKVCNHTVWRYSRELRNI